MFLFSLYSLLCGLLPDGLASLFMVAFILFCAFTVVGVIMSFIYIINELRRLFHG